MSIAARPPSAALPRDAVTIAWALVAAGAVFATAALVDPRTLARGEDVWAKPLRFALAFAVQVATLLWLRARLSATGWRRAAFDLVVRAQAWICLAELLLIALQGARGVESHFNYATGFDRALFTLMGVGTAGVLLTCLVGAAVAASRRPFDLAVAAGLLCCAAGGLVGVWMTFPTPEQAAALQAELRPQVIGAAHAAATGPGRDER